ncbi:hypothetical protein MUK42_14985 [Musa troglodytarum]|uniref:Uncharacterized protein n=1 Tax=Musa troglodytarum TaxID=320322 RepID=A0A9E7L9K3_9LILI|nr:hypothetical protein MUK42_14985 [Musa troglodytarum]
MPLVVEPTGREIMTMIEGVRQQWRRRRTSRAMAESVEEVWEVARVGVWMESVILREVVVELFGWCCRLGLVGRDCPF